MWIPNCIFLQVREILDAMQTDSNLKLEKLLVDGGMTKNDLLMQIQADFLGNCFEKLDHSDNEISVFTWAQQSYILKNRIIKFLCSAFNIAFRILIFSKLSRLMLLSSNQSKNQKTKFDRIDS